MEIGNLQEKEFKIMRVKMIQDIGKRMEARNVASEEMQLEWMQEMFNKT